MTECATPGCCDCVGLPRCPVCNYSAHDAEFHADHFGCAGVIPVEAVDDASTKPGMTRIMGRAINLDGLDTPRQVWLGRQEDGFCVKFTNAEGEPTRLWLSGESIEALTDLYKTELAHPAAFPR